MLASQFRKLLWLCLAHCMACLQRYGRGSRMARRVFITAAHLQRCRRRFCRVCRIFLHTAHLQRLGLRQSRAARALAAAAAAGLLVDQHRAAGLAVEQAVGRVNQRQRLQRVVARAAGRALVLLHGVPGARAPARAISRALHAAAELCSRPSTTTLQQACLHRCSHERGLQQRVACTALALSRMTGVACSLSRAGDAWTLRWPLRSERAGCKARVSAARAAALQGERAAQTCGPRLFCTASLSRRRRRCRRRLATSTMRP